MNWGSRGTCLVISCIFIYQVWFFVPHQWCLSSFHWIFCQQEWVLQQRLAYLWLLWLLEQSKQIQVVLAFKMWPISFYRNSWPNTPYIKSIGYWVLLCYISVFYCLLEYCVVLSLTKRGTTAKTGQQVHLYLWLQL